MGGGAGSGALGIGGAAAGLLWSAPHLMQNRMPGWSTCPQEEHTADLGGATAGVLAAAEGGGEELTGGGGAGSGAFGIAGVVAALF
jgi:hypothetical protein